MPQLELKDGTKTLEIVSVTSLTIGEPDVISLNEYLDKFNTITPLTKFEVKQDIVDPTKYNYRFDADDGRIWKQEIFSDPVEYNMTFDVTDKWKLSQFASQRPIRDIVIRLIKNFGISKIECNWL